MPPDFGPLYKETDLSHFLAEPWNAFSSLTFWIPVFYYAQKVKNDYKNYLFLISCMPLLFIGGLGSTLFHAFRKYPAFLYMDWMPIMILSLMITVYFWQEVLKKWLYTIILLASTFLIRWAVFEFLKPYKLSQNAFINVNYTLTVLIVATPLVILLIRNKGKDLLWLLSSGVSFALAIISRVIDREQDWLSIGTHWLWHVFCAVGAFCLAEYLYRYQKHKIITKINPA